MLALQAGHKGSTPLSSTLEQHIGDHEVQTKLVWIRELSRE